MSVSRRHALKHLGAVGAGLALAPSSIRGWFGPITVAGRAAEIAVASVSPSTVRLTVLPVEGASAAAVAEDGALVAAATGRAIARGRTAESLASSIRAGSLTVRFTADPPTLHIDGPAGRDVQRIALDAAAGDVKFRLSEGPVLGFGEGGPQFDRKGVVDRMRNGQGGEKMRTRGGGVPIQWLVG